MSTDIAHSNISYNSSSPADIARDQASSWIAGVPLMTPEQSAAYLVKVIDTCTRENEGGNFLEYDGGRWEW